jgi:hypothetical protein
LQDQIAILIETDAAVGSVQLLLEDQGEPVEGLNPNDSQVLVAWLETRTREMGRAWIFQNRSHRALAVAATTLHFLCICTPTLPPR